MKLRAGAGEISEVLDRVAEAKVAERWRLFGPECDERRRRVWAASEARAHGPAGVALVARVTGVAEETVRRGLGELESGERVERGQVGELVVGAGPCLRTTLRWSGIWIG